MNWWMIVFQVIGGLGMFLYGMELMSDGLQKSAGKSLRTILSKLTINRFAGAATGVGVTAVIQSSSATSVMTVGFVSAGLLNLTQGLSIILGANIGTTLTAQFLAFNVSKLALPCISIGVILKVFTKNARNHHIGEVLLGFGFLFFGLDLMKDAFGPLKSSQEFKDIFIKFSGNPFSALLTGTLVTVIVQSSSATIGITMALAASGLIGFPSAVALVMGGNVGTTVTANLAAITGNRTAKQTAFGHFIFNVLGVVYMLAFLKVFILMIDKFTPGDVNEVLANGTMPNIERHIANAHTAFNLINFAMFLPILGVIAKICRKVIKGQDEDGYQIIKISDSLASSPALAMSQVRDEIENMGSAAINMLEKAQNAFDSGKSKYFNTIAELEEDTDLYKAELSDFITKLMKSDISSYSDEVTHMLTVVNELEKIGDRVNNIAKFLKIMKDENMSPHEKSEKEICKVFDKALKFLNITLAAYNNTKIKSTDLSLEDEIDDLQDQFKIANIKRITKNHQNTKTGFIYVDILHNLEKIADHTLNIGEIINKRST